MSRRQQHVLLLFYKEPTHGRRSYNQRYDQRCSSKGQPRKIPLLDVPLPTPVHRPLYVAAKTATPKLTWGTASSGRR
jgi:hypothetical protein